MTYIFGCDFDTTIFTHTKCPSVKIDVLAALAYRGKSLVQELTMEYNRKKSIQNSSRNNVQQI